MKRLVIALVAAMAVTTFAQGKELGGSWVFDSEKSGGQKGPGELTITVTAKTVAIQMGSATSETVTFNLDGTEGPLSRGGKTKAVWKDNKLEATLISADGKAQSITFAREGAWLVESGVTPRGTMKMYFKKAPAK